MRITYFFSSVLKQGFFYGFTGTELGTVVKQVTANDVDLNPILTYDFAANGNPEEAFSIDRYSGKIAIAKPLDYERMSRYQLRIQVGLVFSSLLKIFYPCVI